MAESVLTTLVVAADALNAVKQAAAESEALQNEMWAQTVRFAKDHSESITAGLVVDSMNEVIDLHAKCVAAARSRIPRSIGLTLLFVSIMAMAMMGYYAGLTGVRVLISRLSLILAFRFGAGVDRGARPPWTGAGTD